jgi:hypothetical protein
MLSGDNTIFLASKLDLKPCNEDTGCKEETNHLQVSMTGQEAWLQSALSSNLWSQALLAQ